MAATPDDVRVEIPAHVALTGLRSFWPSSGSVWLVSPSCVPQSDAIGSNAAAVAGVIPFPWTHEDLPSVHADLQARYEGLLTFLAGKLNEIHAVQRSRAYWHLVVGPWLFSFVNLITHHHASLTLARRRLGELETVGLHEDCFLTPATPLEFLYEASDDLYNHQLYTRLADAMGIALTERRRVGTEQRLSQSENPENLPKPRLSFRRRVAARLLYELDTRSEPLLARRARFLFRRSRLPAGFERKLVLATGARIWVHRGPLYRRAGDVRSPLDLDRRSRLDGYPGADEAGQIAGVLLSREIPLAFVEDYQDLCGFVERTYGRREPDIVLSTVSWTYDVAFTHFAGMRMEAGARLVGGQESGIFGVEANSQMESHERSLTHTYLTWGWTDAHDSRCIPTTATRLVEVRERARSESGEGILYVGTIALRYPVVARPDFSNYFELQRRFFSAVDPEFRRQFRVRPHTAEFGWGVKRRLAEAFPDLVLEQWDRPFTESLISCRLYVCDHLSTTFTEALASNIPTILFWDPVFVAVRESAEPFFDRLRAIGVVHDTPESAAAWVRRVYDDVDGWWFAGDTQAAVRAFRHEFARTSATPLKDWISLIEQLTAAPPPDPGAIGKFGPRERPRNLSDSRGFGVTSGRETVAADAGGQPSPPAITSS